MFLATWKDIPNENELQYQIKDCHLNAGRQICQKSHEHVKLFLPACLLFSLALYFFIW